MRAVYLIARREYVGYVATVGFWLSLLMVPVFAGIGFAIPNLTERTQPVRAFVITGGPEIAAALDAQVEAMRRGIVRERFRNEIALVATNDVRAAALAAFDAAPSTEAGLAAGRAALGEGSTAGGLDVRETIARLEGPQLRTLEDAKPYLAGERMLETADGPRQLDAFVIVRRTASGGFEADVWGQPQRIGPIDGAVARGLQELLRQEGLRAAGFDLAQIEEIEKRRPVVRELNPARSDAAGDEAEVRLSDRLPFIVSFIAGMALWSVIFSVANMLLTSTVEEKGAKIFEALLSTARPIEILWGKLFGVAAVSATLLAVWAGTVAGLGLIVGGQGGPSLPPDVIAIITDPMLWLPFGFYFICGYLIFGAVFLAIGSLCETIQEAQTLMSPMIFVTMAPLIVLVIGASNPEAGWVQAASWFPLFTPYVMMLRMPTEPPLWEIIGTGLVLLVTMIAVVAGASSVFRGGVAGALTSATLFRRGDRRTKTAEG